MNTKTDAAPAEPPRKPRLSLFFATAGGAGYLPKAPGTWGSLVGVLLFWITDRAFANVGYWQADYIGHDVITFHSYAPYIEVGLSIAIALVGVWVAGRIVKFTGKKDPQFVVIDEVSGQFFTFLFALISLNWKYLLLGFILFRAFDIWKPFPARQAESLPGGWGIMADDWAAAVYAAIGIWIARGLGL